MPFPRHRSSGDDSARPAPPASNPGFYTYAIVVFVVVASLLAGFLIYRVGFNKAQAPPSMDFDLSSLFIKGAQAAPHTAQLVDPSNPCMVVQEFLELIRTGRDEEAYDLLASGLRDTTSLPDFIRNNDKNAPLFKNVEGYDFGTFSVDPQTGKAVLTGYVNYAGGGRSEVKAYLVSRDGAWRIDVVTVAYQ